MILALVDLLANYYQAGDLTQVEVVARSMLAAMPDDIVSLQFLGLALYQTGRIRDAYETFRQVAQISGPAAPIRHPTTCESAAAISYRAATAIPELSHAWWQIAKILTEFGFRLAALKAFRAAVNAGRQGAAVVSPSRPSRPNSTVAVLMAEGPSTSPFRHSDDS